MERRNVEIVNPDSTAYPVTLCAVAHDSAINAGPEPPNRFHFFSSNFPECTTTVCSAISIGRFRRLLICRRFFSPILYSQAVFVIKLIKRRAHFLYALKYLFQTCDWINQFENAMITI